MILHRNCLIFNNSESTVVISHLSKTYLSQNNVRVYLYISIDDIDKLTHLLTVTATRGVGCVEPHVESVVSVSPVVVSAIFVFPSHKKQCI